MVARQMMFQWLGFSGAKTASMSQAVVYQAPHICPNGRNMADRQEVLRLAMWDLRKPS